ncbi:MAG TPA: MBL fold metallo-hydrolase [Anaerolineae bacterium]
MSTVRVQFLGSGDAFGSGGRLQTCIYIETESIRFLIDCGATALSGMKRFGIDPASIDLILLSHLHGDHFGGLPFLIPELRLVSKRIRPLLIAGPAGAADRIQAAMENFFPGSSQMQGFPLEFIELFDRQPTRIESLTVTPHRVVHSPGTNPYALRIECANKIIAYSGDTEWVASLFDAARGADLFICEAYFYEKQVKYHVSYQTLQAQRQALDCRRLIVTHMSDDMLGRLADIEVEWAEDGLRIDL